MAQRFGIIATLIVNLEQRHFMRELMRLDDWPPSVPREKSMADKKSFAYRCDGTQHVYINPATHCVCGANPNVFLPVAAPLSMEGTTADTSTDDERDVHRLIGLITSGEEQPTAREHALVIEIVSLRM